MPDARRWRSEARPKRKKPSSRAAPQRAWQRMLSGRRLDLLDPSPLDIEIADIAHGLARVARWNGQTHGPHIFSVAQHSLLVEAIVARDRRRTPIARCACSRCCTTRRNMSSATSSRRSRRSSAMPTRRPRTASSARSSCASACRHAPRRRRQSSSRPRTARPPFTRRQNWPDSLWTRRTNISAGPRRRPPALADLLQPLSSEEAQAKFLARFDAMDGMNR